MFITRPNCALDRRKISCLYVPGFQSQVYKHDEGFSEQIKKFKKQKKKKLNILVAESAYISHKAQFVLVMFFFSLVNLVRLD